MIRENSYTMTTKLDDAELVRLLRAWEAAVPNGACAAGSETAQVAG